MHTRIKPGSMKLISEEIPVNPEAEVPEGMPVETRTRITLDLIDKNGSFVSVGPWSQSEWDQVLAYLNDPEAAKAKQEVQRRITVVTGAEAARVGRMAPSVGRRK